jgi:hypothetical protein
VGVGQVPGLDARELVVDTTMDAAIQTYD